MSRSILSAHADENGTYHVEMTFKDEAGANMSPDTAKWTLTDVKGTVINSRSSVDIASPSYFERVTLSSNDLAIADNKDKKVVFTVYGTYTSSYATAKPFEDEVVITVDKHVKNKV